MALLLVLTLAAFQPALSADLPKPGFSDTPLLPGQAWRVSDSERPAPRPVEPGATFSHLAKPPSDATILFNGRDLSAWVSQDGSEPKWTLEHGYMEVNGTGSLRTKEEFPDFQLHLEFATPTRIQESGQGRGNSGVLIFGKYEVQILDSYNNPTYADGQVGALYAQTPPLVSCPRPPGVWQTYDIVFESARWDSSGKLTRPAHVTVLLNGVVVHHRKELIGFVQHRAVASYDAPHPPQGPILLQDHQNPVRFRNIWIRPLGDYDSN